MFNSKKNFRKEIIEAMEKDEDLEYSSLDDDKNNDASSIFSNVNTLDDYEYNSNSDESEDDYSSSAYSENDFESDSSESSNSENNSVITNKNNDDVDKESIFENTENEESSDDDSTDDVLLFQKRDYSVQNELNMIFHKFSEKPYYFLTDHRYTKNISLDENVTYNIQLFIHLLCNNTENDPYILFIQEFNKNNNDYNIPKFSYNLQIHTKKEDGFVDTTDLNNKIKEFVFNIFNISPEQMNEHSVSEINNSIYGFYKKDTNIIVGINGIPYVDMLTNDTPLLSHFFYKNIEDNVPKYCSSTIKNVLEFKEFYKKPINTECENMLRSNKWLWEIKNDKGSTTELPVIMFSSKIKENKIDIDKLNNAILPYRYEFGNLYMYTFSNEISFKKELFEKKEIQEYVIFKNNCLNEDLNSINKIWEDNSYNSLEFSLNKLKCLGIISHKFFHKL